MNVLYQFMNILELDKKPPSVSSSLNKVLMYEALQYVRKQELITILKNILRLSSKSCLMLFGSVPGATRKWNVFNTPKIWLIYVARKTFGKEAIGTWWDKEFIQTGCKKLDLICEFKEQRKESHASHYRFDVLITHLDA